MSKPSSEQRFFFTENKVPFKNSTNMEVNVMPTYSDLKPQAANLLKPTALKENNNVEFRKELSSQVPNG